MSRSHKRSPVAKPPNDRYFKRQASKSARRIINDDIPSGNRRRYMRMGIDKWKICDYSFHLFNKGHEDDTPEEFNLFMKWYVRK